MSGSRRPFAFTFHLYWSPDQNTPILNPQLARGTSSFLIRLRPTEPGDVRPAFPYDVSIVREAIYAEFQDWRVADLLIPQGSVVLLNKVPGYPDEADEVFVNGELVGHRWFDPLRGTWRFRPLMHGVARLLEQKMGYYAIVDLPKLVRGFEVHRDRVVGGELPPRRGMLLAVQTRDGRWQALARLSRGRRLYIVKAWRSVKPYYIEARSSMRDLIEVNRPEIERRAERARRFIRRVCERYGSARRVVVSYSGGKDSLAVLDLTLETLRDFYVIFNDTTLELPDTYKNVHEVERRLGVSIEWARATALFTEIVRIYAPPARDFRYCCKMLKLAPISALLNKIAPGGTISIVGQRKYESTLRAKLPQVAQSRWVANTIVAAPIDDWTSLHVWLYVLDRGLPYNQAYEKGFDRIGCWVCPANEIAEIELAKIWYPELYEWWNNLLNELRQELKLPEIWLRAGLWRWRSKYPGDVRRFLELNLKRVDLDNLLESYRTKTTLIDLTRTNGSYIITIHKTKLSVVELACRLVNMMRTLKNIDVLESAQLNNMVKISLISRNTRSRIELLIQRQDDATSKMILDPSPNREDLVNILRVVARVVYCTGCGLCVTWCKTGATRLEERRAIVIWERCSRCGLCNVACPAAEYLVARSGIMAKAEVAAR